MARIDALFDNMLQQRGSDLHLEQGQVPKIRLRGELIPISGYGVLTQEHMPALIREIVEPERWQLFERQGDLNFTYAPQIGVRFRACYFRHFFGYGAVFRAIPKRVPTLDEIGAPETVKKFSAFRSGLILVTGPTGCGKSTAVAALIDAINRQSNRKIVTLEAPVEFVHTSQKSMVIHREVGPDTVSFAAGLRGALKAGANVIMVANMSDQETIELALNSVEMGVLLIGVLNTNSATEALDRIVDSFPGSKKEQVRSLLANSLRAVLTQHLLKSVNQARRWAAHEVLIQGPGLSSMIRSGDTSKIMSMIQTGKKQGMICLDDSLLALVKENKVTRETALPVAQDHERFLRMLKQSKSPSGPTSG